MIDMLLKRLPRVWLVTALVDGIFASCLSVFRDGSTVMRLWQGVASTVLGPSAFEGGVRTMLVGLLMHLGVALAWSALLLIAATSWPRFRQLIASPGRSFAVAAVYGPSIWSVMSFGVIPLLTGHPPTMGVRWVVQALGHIFFVALPIVVMTARAVGADVRNA